MRPKCDVATTLHAGWVITDGANFYHLPIENDLKTYDNIRKIVTGQEDDYTTGCLLDYPYFKEHYKQIKNRTIDLSKQEKLDADPKAIQQINFTGNLEKIVTIFFIIEEAKEITLDISKLKVNSL